MYVVLLLCLCGFIASLSFPIPSLCWLVGWYTHLGSLPPQLSWPPAPSDPQAPSLLLTVGTPSLTRKQPIVETLSYFGSHCALMAVIIPRSIPSHSPSPLKQSSCPTGSTFCFDCMSHAVFCWWIVMSEIYFTRGGWVVSRIPNLSC